MNPESRLPIPMKLPSLFPNMHSITRATWLVMGVLAYPLTPTCKAEDLKLKNGKILINICTVTDAGDRVKVMHDAGIAALPKREVPVEFLKAHDISPDATPLAAPAPATATTTSAATNNANASATVSAKEREERALTAASILGNQPWWIEFTIVRYDKGVFYGEGKVFITKKEEEKVNGRLNGLTRKMIYDTRVVERAKEEVFLGSMMVFGLPKTLVGQKVWKGQLWLGGRIVHESDHRVLIDKERDAIIEKDVEAFTSRELGMKYMIENGTEGLEALSIKQ